MLDFDSEGQIWKKKEKKQNDPPPPQNNMLRANCSYGKVFCEGMFPKQRCKCQRFHIGGTWSLTWHDKPHLWLIKVIQE